MSRKFIYDDNDKLIDFEDDAYDFIEKDFSGLIGVIFVKEKTTGRPAFFNIVPKTHKQKEIREKIFGYSFASEEEMREKYKTSARFGGCVGGKNYWF